MRHIRNPLRRPYGRLMGHINYFTTQTKEDYLMTKEIIKPEETKEVSAIGNDGLSEEALVNLNSMAEPTTYIPSIRPTYTTSSQFKDSRAKFGDFWFEEQTFGNTIEATVVAYRYQAIGLKDKEFQENLIMAESSIKFRECPEYLAFKERVMAWKDGALEDGVDLLLYLPEYKVFGVLFCKKKLYPGGLECLKKGTNGRLITIHGKRVDWKTFSWIVFVIGEKNERIEVPGNTGKKIEIYNSQIEKALSPEDKEKEDGHAR